MNPQTAKPKRAKSRLGCVECKAKRVGERRANRQSCPNSHLLHPSLTLYSGSAMRQSHRANNANDEISLALVTGRPSVGRRNMNFRGLISSELKTTLRKLAASQSIHQSGSTTSMLCLSAPRMNTSQALTSNSKLCSTLSKME